MSQQTESRTVMVGDDDITIYDVSHPSSWYTTAYQNKDTRTLDETFGLTGEPIPRDSDIANCLRLSTGPSSLGKSEVEQVLRVFCSSCSTSR